MGGGVAYQWQGGVPLSVEKTNCVLLMLGGFEKDVVWGVKQGEVYHMVRLEKKKQQENNTKH